MTESVVNVLFVDRFYFNKNNCFRHVYLFALIQNKQRGKLKLLDVLFRLKFNRIS